MSEVATKVRKVTAKKRTTSNNSKKKTTAPDCVEVSTNKLSEEARTKLISEIAYCRAEARNFEGDAELEDWLEAEAEVNDKHSRKVGQS